MLDQQTAEPMPEPVVRDEPVKIVVTREPFSDYFVLTLPDGKTEELEVEETRAWFKAHGAVNIDNLESGLDFCWNFGSDIIWIENFKQPVFKYPAFEPQV